MFRCTLLKGECLSEVSAEIDRLAAQIPYTVHQRAAWYQVYCQTQGRRVSPRFLVVYEIPRNTVVGILPLQVAAYRGTRLWNLRRIEPLARGPSDFFNFLVESGREIEVSETFAMWFWQNRMRWEQLVLDLIPETSPCWRPFVAKLEQLGFVVETDQSRRFYRIDTTQDWQSFERDFLHKRLADMRNRRNRLEKHGLKIQIETITQDIQEHLPKLFEVYHQRRIAKGQSYATSSPEMRCFLTKVVAAYERLNSVRLSLLREHQGQVMAYQLDWVHQGIRYHYKPTFLAHFGQYSPGKILLFETIRESFFDPEIVEFNFMRGESEYKTQFADQSEAFVTIRVTNPWSALAKITGFASRLVRLRDSASKLIP